MNASEQELLDRYALSGEASAKVQGWANGARMFAVLRGLQERGWFRYLGRPRGRDELLEFSGLATVQFEDVLAVLDAHGVVEQQAGIVRLTPSFAELVADDASIGLDEILDASVLGLEQSRGAVAPGTTPMTERDALVVARGSGGRANDITKVVYEEYWLVHLPEVSEALRAGRFLDVGCGVATTSLTLARIFPETSVLGIDVVPAVVDEARRRAEALGVQDRAEFRCVDAQEFDQVDGFGTAFWAQPFFPEPTRAKTLAAIFQALHPGGLLILQEMMPPPTDQAKLPAYTLRRLAIRATGRPFGGTAEELVAEAESAGFTLARIALADSERYVIMRRPD
ncbi:SAM-dependent methyltransferase [Kribbella sp. NPDC051586]|uniref:SAM-dependent methyltransferase n=1 Tax=Kribbella sp. NPDC051586 TaxID=3364118 RepID=UPI00379DCD1A